jgi:hypothetical protein
MSECADSKPAKRKAGLRLSTAGILPGSVLTRYEMIRVDLVLLKLPFATNKQLTVIYSLMAMLDFVAIIKKQLP